MIKEKIENVKNALVKSEKNGKKKSIENLVVLAIILIVTIMAINYIWKGNDKKTKNTNNGKILANDQINSSTTIEDNDRR